jgi:nicotinate-nucleotide pyrophosphorylase (carboxylating)
MRSLSPHTGFGAAEEVAAKILLDLALAEDLGTPGDLTSAATIPETAQGTAVFVARVPGVFAGLPVVELMAKQFGLSQGFTPMIADGSCVEKGDQIARVTGSMRAILAMERTALNFLQRLSGVATLTRQFVDCVAGTKAVILDTRKTTPGWRLLEKYAVRCGGGQNHRMGLYDAILIKDNHLAWLDRDSDPIGLAVANARKLAPQAAFVEVEVDRLEQFDRALATDADIILLDNFPLENMVEAVRRRDAAHSIALLEASGGVNLETVRAIACTGVNRISVGALTHSAPALDIALDVEAFEA